MTEIQERLEQLRLALRNEDMSYSELAELQSLAAYIPEHDVELREAAGVPEFEEDDDQGDAMVDGDYLADFLAAYIECALWSSTHTIDVEDAVLFPDCEEGDDISLDAHFDADDLAPEALEEMTKDCSDFIRANWRDLSAWPSRGHWSPAEQAGHDFWLTRNGHGTGFWDRGLGELGERLTEACKPYGECWLYPAADGKVYAS